MLSFIQDLLFAIKDNNYQLAKSNKLKLALIKFKSIKYKSLNCKFVTAITLFFIIVIDFLIMGFAYSFYESFNLINLFIGVIACLIIDSIYFRIFTNHYLKLDLVQQVLNDTYKDLKFLNLVSPQDIDIFYNNVSLQALKMTPLSDPLHGNTITFIEYNLLVLMTYAKLTNQYKSAKEILTHNKKLLTYGKAYTQIDNLNVFHLKHSQLEEYPHMLDKTNEQLLTFLMSSLNREIDNIIDNHPGLLSILPSNVKETLRKNIYNKVNPYKKLSKGKY